MSQSIIGQPVDDIGFKTDSRSPTAARPPVSHDYASAVHQDIPPAPGPAQPTPKKRKLVVCIDGTSNQYSDKAEQNTNVIEIYHYIKKDSSQLTYYNSGIGTYAKPSWRSYTYLKQTMSNAIDLAIAWNLEKVIIGAYRWLSDTYQDGDQIFLFGFSRGAYQVRALAAMIESVGLIYAGNQEQIPFAWELYSNNQSDEMHYQTKVATFKKTFSRNSVGIHFLGAWDTVSSVGVLRRKLLPMTGGCSHIKHFRHALALDERRVKFIPEYTQSQKRPKNEGYTMKEVWFAGTHSDIGGGNKENPNLSNGTEPLRWMISEAEQAGLAFHRSYKNIQAKPGNDNYGDVTESLVGFWKLIEILPIPWQPHYSSHTTWRPHMGKGREIIPEQKLHWTVLANHTYAQGNKNNGYKPKALITREDAKEASWEEVFRPPPKSATDRIARLPEWEGDMDLINALKFIRQLDQSLASQQLGYPWLTELFEYITKPDRANIIWMYGGTKFLRGLVDVSGGQKVKPRNIIRVIVGCGDVKASKIPQLPGQKGVATNSTKTVSDTGTNGTDDSEFENTVAKILRLNELVPLCEFPAYGQGAANLDPRRKSWISLFMSKPSAETTIVPTNPNKPYAHASTYSMELAKIVIEMILELMSKFASQVIQAIAPIAQHYGGRQKLLNSGVTKKLLPLLEISDNTDKELISRIIDTFIGLASHGETAECLMSHEITQPLVELLEKDWLEEKTIKGVLNTLTRGLNAFEGVFDELKASRLVDLMSNHSEAIDFVASLIGSRNFRLLLFEGDIVKRLQELLVKNEDALLERSLGLTGALFSYGELKDTATNVAISQSILHLVKRSIPSYSVLEAMKGISGYSELMSLAILEALMQILQSEASDNSKSTVLEIVATTIASATPGTGWHDIISPTLAPILVDLAKTMNAPLLYTTLKTILDLSKKGMVIDAKDLVQITSDRLVAIHQDHAFENIGYYYLYNDISEKVFDLVRHLSRDDENRAALLEAGAYTSVSRLRNESLTLTTDLRASKLVSDLRDLGDAKLNNEMDKHDHLDNPDTDLEETEGPRVSEDEGNSSPNTTHEHLLGEGAQ